MFPRSSHDAHSTILGFRAPQGDLIIVCMSIMKSLKAHCSPAPVAWLDSPAERRRLSAKNMNSGQVAHCLLLAMNQLKVLSLSNFGIAQEIMSLPYVLAHNSTCSNYRSLNIFPPNYNSPTTHSPCVVLLLFILHFLIHQLLFSKLSFSTFSISNSFSNLSSPCCY